MMIIHYSEGISFFLLYYDNYESKQEKIIIVNAYQYIGHNIGIVIKKQ